MSAVTLLYLYQNPGLYEDFLDWEYVAVYKFHQAAISSGYGAELISKEQREEVEKLYLSVREKYKFKSCKCGAERYNHTWTRTDIPSMAKKTELAGLVIPAYYVPNSHLHSTPKAIFARLEISPEGVAGFRVASHTREADQALVYGHDIVLSVLSLQERHFHPGLLSDSLAVAVRDYEGIWSAKASCALS